MTTTEIAAQAGDEPMREDFEAWLQTKFPRNVIRDSSGYLDDRIAWAWEGYQASQVSPRATADAEREAKRHAERVERLVRAAKVYTFNYLQDEHEEAELCTCGPKQHAELVELFAALAAIATTKPGA